ncbi:cell division protein ZapD [Aquabacterium sp. OR-4]|uniref:cell division protein ZapD n=1 Tax=Aquabacterium sp. OR-4 TaxID=2978127 RepID=UPI0028C9555D|nr:cell division protein ZapD [Aquabacterium sp. OR-4]MDT7837340.1 cell division protein ZapD [Aquabacterium sp. OR-4]
MVLYEYPFNESMRTMLRLEHLFDRLGQLIVRDAPVDHHFALVSLFEIVEVASRSDLKSDLLKDLDRHRSHLGSLRDNPQVQGQALESLIARLDQAFEQLNAQTGKAGQALAGNEWLTSVKSRISIPGGTCEFDLPAYYAWQQLDAGRRRQDLLGWVNTLAPLAGALQLLLQLLRESGVPHMVASTAGQFQQSLPQGRSYQLLRLRIDGDSGLVPEITGHRLMVSVRLMRVDGDGRLRPAGADAPLELTLCA